METGAVTRIAKAALHPQILGECPMSGERQLRFRKHLANAELAGDGQYRGTKTADVGSFTPYRPKSTLAEPEMTCSVTVPETSSGTYIDANDAELTAPGTDV
jgi:hypothetical protein